MRLLGQRGSGFLDEILGNFPDILSRSHQQGLLLNLLIFLSFELAEGLLEVRKDVLDRPVLLLHFLVVAPALVCRAGGDEFGHLLEHLGGSSPLFVLEMGGVVLHELQIENLLVKVPAPHLRFSLAVFGLVAVEIAAGVGVILRGQHGDCGEVVLGVEGGEDLEKCVCLHEETIIQI